MPRSITTWVRIALVLLVVAGATFLASAEEQEDGKDDSIITAIKDGTLDLDIRYRYEQADENDFDLKARANTIRLRLGWTTAAWHGLIANAGFSHTEVLGDDNFNSGRNGKGGEYPLIPDPQVTVLQRTYLGYVGLENNRFILGRQRINLDNQRFIGSVAWRQNEQTFDSFSAAGKPWKKLEYFYAHLSKVNTVIGTRFSTSSDLFNVNWNFRYGKAVVYAYLLDLENIPLRSSKTFGVRFKGDVNVSETISVGYTGEYANQSSYEDGASFVDADYWFLEGGADFGPVDVKLAYELLGGNGQYGFSTPLATLHKFNGWADKFLLTPDDGLQDLFVTARGQIKGIVLMAVYHRFDADTGGGKFGNEIDFAATKWFRERYMVRLGYADFSTDDSALYASSKRFWFGLRLRL